MNLPRLDYFNIKNLIFYSSTGNPTVSFNRLFSQWLYSYYFGVVASASFEYAESPSAFVARTR